MGLGPFPTLWVCLNFLTLVLQLKKLGKSMHQEHGGGFGGHIVINCMRLDGIMVYIHGWFALFLLLQVFNSLFVYPETCFNGMEL